MKFRLPIVDSHLHLWDPGRLEYPWLADLPDLRRPFRPADLDTGAYRLAGVVFVEAGRRDDQAFDEVDWVGELAADWPELLGVVAHAPLERGDAVAGLLRMLSTRPLVRGIRRNIQDEPPGFALADNHLAGLRLLADYGLTADLCVRHHQLAEVTELARRVPEVTFVLDHVGKPDVRGAVGTPWREDLSRLAGLPNVACKLSGLATEADWTSWRDDDVAPYLRHALAEFGPDRCLFGSDWPVATLATGYERWLETVAATVSGLPAESQAEVFGGTAARVYRISPGTTASGGGTS